MISKDDAENLLYESKENIVDMLCSQSELVDDLYIKLKAKDEEIERLKVELKRDLNEPLKSITINQMGGGKDEYKIRNTSNA